MRVMPRPPQPDEARPSDAGRSPETVAPLRVYNHKKLPLGGAVLRVVDLLKRNLGQPVVRRAAAELPQTFADIEPLAADFGFRPATTLEVGRLVEWWRGR